MPRHPQVSRTPRSLRCFLRAPATSTGQPEPTSDVGPPRLRPVRRGPSRSLARSPCNGPPSSPPPPPPSRYRGGRLISIRKVSPKFAAVRAKTPSTTASRPDERMTGPEGDVLRLALLEPWVHGGQHSRYVALAERFVRALQELCVLGHLGPPFFRTRNRVRLSKLLGRRSVAHTKPPRPSSQQPDGRSMRPLRRAGGPEGTRVRAGLRSGDGPLSVRVRPSSPKRDRARRATSTGGKTPVNVHAKSRLTLESLRTLGC